MRKSAAAGIGAVRRCLQRPALGVALLAPGLARAASFKQAPGIEKPEESDSDMILGVVHANTRFFVALGVFAVFWFLLGGGRKAKVGRKGH